MLIKSQLLLSMMANFKGTCLVWDGLSTMSCEQTDLQSKCGSYCVAEDWQWWSASLCMHCGDVFNACVGFPYVVWVFLSQWCVCVCRKAERWSRSVCKLPSKALHSIIHTLSSSASVGPLLCSTAQEEVVFFFFPQSKIKSNTTKLYIWFF